MSNSGLHHLEASLRVERLNQILDRFSSLRIGVIGDVMLDRYIRGTADRLSPEAPVPVVEVREESDHPGGAANVASNLASLGISVSLFGVTGDDLAGGRLLELLRADGIESGGLISEAGYRSTVKTRVIADGQHIVRADREPEREPTADTAESLIRHLSDAVGDLDALILQDYNKGTLGPKTIERAIEIARGAGVPTFVDPKRNNFFAYRGVTLFKPNRREVEDALGLSVPDHHAAHALIDEIRTRLEAEIVVITLGDQGMVVEGDQGAIHVETTAIQVADVSGAGDTVISLLAAAIGSGAAPVEAVLLANAAAGIVCERVGTVAVTVDELRTVIGNRGDIGLVGEVLGEDRGGRNVAG